MLFEAGASVATTISVDFGLVVIVITSKKA